MIVRPVCLMSFLRTILLICVLFYGAGTAAQANNISARLVLEQSAPDATEMTAAIVFDPAEGWHGYWSNPGDAGYGMQLEWDLPEGWQAGDPAYPVPQTLLIEGLMNHVYEGPYTVLVPITRLPDSPDWQGQSQSIGVDAQWLACTDSICVPEQAFLTGSTGAAISGNAHQFDQWRAEIPPLLDQEGTYKLTTGALRLAIPIPASAAIENPHLFIASRDVVNYAGEQTFYRNSDQLIITIPLAKTVKSPDQITGILAFDGRNGVRFVAHSGAVPDGGVPLSSPASTPALPLWSLLLGAVLGGLLLNIMPCVFPILSLKALSLARSGESETQARHEGFAYTAGVMIACLGLGVLLLALRAGGEQIGWAFQLQEPAVVVALLALALGLTANFIGLYDIPSLSLQGSGKPAGAFTTGLLAAFVATPCTGPFMAAALGAALILPAAQALFLFAALGFGLALPFLLVGTIPRLRALLPRPGPWMETFRKLMALPMGLTVLALLWLCWRMGGGVFAGEALLFACAVTVICIGVSGKRNMALASGGALSAIVLAGAMWWHPAQSPSQDEAAGIHAPQTYSAANLAQARRSGKPVFVWFTADWCLTCKVNESVAIEREETRSAFEQAGVIAIRGDWTRRDAEITRFLTDHGAAGVPYYIWYAPGAEGEQLPQVLTIEMLVDRANQAR